MRRAPILPCLPGAIAAAALLAMSACTVPLNFGGGRGGGPAPSADAVAACNTRGDEVFLRQNRDVLYKQDSYETSQRDSPYASNGVLGSTEDLSNQYERNRDVRDCLNGASPAVAPQKTAP